jgi:Flp pilus assembly protein TadG
MERKMDRRIWHGLRGQTLVEFALVLPVLIAIVFGLLDVGRYVYMSSVVSQAAREGARLAAVEASWMGSSDPACGTAGGPVCPADVTALAAHVTVAANRMVAPFGSVQNVYVRCDALGSAPTSSTWTGVACGSGNRSPNSNVVSTRVDLTYSPLTPVISNFVLTLSGSATMVIN